MEALCWSPFSQVICPLLDFLRKVNRRGAVHGDESVSLLCLNHADSLCCAGEGRVHKCLWDNKDKISKACQKEERKIQIMQSSNTELMPNLAKACKSERAAHCKSVRPGKSRLYNCLVSNSDSVSAISYQSKARTYQWKSGFLLYFCSKFARRV